MNDFTKEELIELYNILEHGCTDPQISLHPWLKLLGKTKSLIENYCEHEWVGDALQITHCKKCGEFYR